MQYFLLLLTTLLPLTLSSETDSCQLEEYGPFSSLLVEWATQPLSNRHGRIMALPPTKGYYVTDRIDQNLLPPPPPPPPSARPYEEWNMTPPGPGKIVNRPQKPYNDHFKPSLPPQQPPKQPQNHRPQPPKIMNTVDRVDEHPPHKQVTETDLYLLGAIEKLVYRADLMEKRLRKVEENLHRLVVGQNKQPAPEPCVGNFTRIGGICYHFSSEPYDWKTSNLACRKLKSNLVEFSSDQERKLVISAVQASKEWKDADFWTGGLNPGLLWIWSHSARPLFNNTASANQTDSSFGIAGEGRCLAVLFEPALRTHVYRGQDCAYRHRFICEKRDDKARLSNEVERVAKSLRPLAETISSTAREAKIYWTKDILDSTND